MTYQLYEYAGNKPRYMWAEMSVETILSYNLPPLTDFDIIKAYRRY